VCVRKRMRMRMRVRPCVRDEREKCQQEQSVRCNAYLVLRRNVNANNDNEVQSERVKTDWCSNTAQSPHDK
jgi:hypothetical protein